MTANAYDVIVVGVGGMGSAACLQLARRGLRVLGLERFEIGNARGSSCGETRIIRRAYFERPDYVPLLERVYPQWAEIEEESGEKLYERTGLLLVGPDTGVVIRGVEQSSSANNIAITRLTAADVRSRFPALHCDDGLVGLYEEDAGYLRCEHAVRVQAALAQRHGATLLTGHRVLHWTADNHGVTVETDHERFVAGRLVLTAGPWASELLTSLGLPLQVRRKVQLWYEAGDAYTAARGFPVWGYHIGDQFFYGFPAIDGAIKLGQHFGGHETTPDEISRALTPADVDEVAGFVHEFLPGVASSKPLRHMVCMYTMTPDENFIVDAHPDYDRVLLIAGLSGHGFKFGPVLGEVLADRVTGGKTDLPVGFLSLRRFGRRRG